MKYWYAAITVIAFVIKLTNAAPPFNIDSILDELLEMNIRLGDVILRAKHDYQELNASNVTDAVGDVAVDGASNQLNGYGSETSNDDEPQSIPSWGEMNLGTGDENAEESTSNPTIQLNGYGQESESGCGCGSNTSNDDESQSSPTWGEMNLETGDDNDEESATNPTIQLNAADKRRERSFFGQPFDGVGNRWNDVVSNSQDNEAGNSQDDEADNSQGADAIDAENDVGTNERVEDVEDDIATVEISDQPIDEPNENSDGLLVKSTEDEVATDPKPEPDNHIDDDDSASVKSTENTEPDSEIENSEPVEGDDKDWGEETSNDAGKDDKEKGWIGNAIDSIVNFFGYINKNDALEIVECE